jgi:hypothetical protein
MSWFRVDADMPDHPKTRALARRLPGVDPVGLVARTWAWMSRFCRTGHVVTCHVTPFAESIASSIGWTGDPSELISGLCDAGWLDRNEDGSVEAHDWAEKQQKVASKAEKDRERQRAHRAKVKALKAGSVTRDMRDGHAVTTWPVTPLRDGTGRDGTIRDGTEEDPRVAEATPPAPGELFESVPPQPTPAQPPKSKPPKPPKTEKPPDPRHAPTVKAVTDAFAKLRGAPYPFAPRDAAAVTALLAALGSPESVEEAWTRALAHKGWPAVATLPQLVQHLAHFVGSPSGESGLRGTGPVRAVVTVNEGIF